MLKLIRRGDSPHWQITGSLQGHGRVRESTGTDSRAHAEAILAQRQKELLDRSVYGERATVTFAEAVNLYLDLGGEARFLAPLIERWGTWKLATITPLEVARAARDIYPGRKPATVARQLYTPVSSILTAAAKADLCAAPSFDRPKIEQTVVDVPNDDWFADLVHAPIGGGPPGSKGYQRSAKARLRLIAIVLFMTTSGARVGDSVNVITRRVNRDTGLVLIPDPKNGDPFKVTLCGAALDALCALPVGKPDDRVFGFKSRWAVNDAIHRICTRYGLRVYTAHKLGRHAFAARFLAEGNTLADLKVAAGWKSIAIVDRYYGHLERSSVDAAVKASGTKLTQHLAMTRSNLLNLKKKDA